MHEKTIILSWLLCIKVIMFSNFQHKMNSCLQKPCPWGFAFHDFIKYQVDFHGGFRSDCLFLHICIVIAISFLSSIIKMFSPNSFSTTGSISGMEFNATAFVGCDNGNVRACTLYD